MRDTQRLPEAVERVLRAADAGDWAAVAAAFTPDGVLDGWGQHLRSRDEIARWGAGDDTRLPAPLSVRGWFRYGDLVTVGVVTDDASSGALTFAFELRGDQVRGLRVSG